MRRSVIGWVMALAVIAGLAVFRSGLPLAGGAAALTVLEVDGEVTRSRLETRNALEVGMSLEDNDLVTTGDAGRAVLGLGAETRIRLGKGSDLQVVQLDDQGLQIELKQGSVTATVRPSSQFVRVTSRGREVQATDAEFAVDVDGERLLVETRRGTLMSRGVAGISGLSDGQSMWVEPSADPKVLEVPGDLLLDVDWPEEARTRETSATVRGHTAPGARIRVVSGAEEVSAVADRDGRFAVPVSLLEGANEVVVRARNSFGEEVEVVSSVIRDTSGPVFRGGIQ